MVFFLPYGHLGDELMYDMCEQQHVFVIRIGHYDPYGIPGRYVPVTGASARNIVSL